MNILVVGGTGGIGLEVAKQALQAGHRVTVLARHPEKVDLREPGLRVQKGDATEPADVEKALAGQDAVVSAIGIPPTRKPVTVFSRGARNLVDAMRKTGKRRLVSVTGIGAGDSRGHGGLLYDRIVRPLLLDTAYRDKDREEAIIRESGLDWIVVRPGFLTNGPKTGKYRVVTRLEGVKAGKVSRADVAGFILEQLENPTHLHEAPLLTP